MDVKMLCLGILGLGEASGYEIKKTLEGPLGSFFDASFGSIYPALAALATSGHVTMEEQPQDKRPDKKVYRITPKGRLALAEALQKAPSRDRVRSEFLASMLFPDLLSPRALAERLDERIAYHKAVIGKLDGALAAPLDDVAAISSGMRFVAEYGLAMHRATLGYIENNRHVIEAASMLRRAQAAD